MIDFVSSKMTLKGFSSASHPKNGDIAIDFDDFLLVTNFQIPETHGWKCSKHPDSPIELSI